MATMSDHPSRAGEVLAAVHRAPGIPRAQVAAALGLSSGLASDLVARLRAAQWLSEGEPAPAAGRGRPTRTLWPHPEGPLVLAAAIFHETWQVDVCELGGGVLDSLAAAHDRGRKPALVALAAGLSQAWDRHGARVRGIAVSAPGTVSATRLVQASNLGWEDVELSALLPPRAVAAAIPFIAGNDANDTAVAEHARGSAQGVEDALVLFMDSGVGGALIDGGRVSAGAHGMAGEFGHLPLGSRRLRCRCGARGCWNTELDAGALARLLRRPLPADEVSFSRGVLTAARDGGAPERRAVQALARALGRGTAGLVNACDPERVVLCGLAASLLAIAPTSLQRAYRGGLMSTRVLDPPLLVAGALGARGPLVGAMEAAFAPVLARPVLDGPSGGE
jgi:predicted NBD/HSP70 family sugar kinase